MVNSGKGREGTFCIWGNGSDLYLDRGLGYTGVYIGLNLISKHTVNICALRCMEILHQKNIELSLMICIAEEF